MAIADLINGKRITLTPQQGLRVWQILNGEREAKENEVEFVSSVKAVYLNRTTAPASYIEKYKHLFYENDPVVIKKTVEKVRLPYND
jgi:hypothetical protein